MTADHVAGQVAFKYALELYVCALVWYMQLGQL